MDKNILQFLKELAANNNRPWFQENKPRYEFLHQAFIEDIQLLINRIALFDPEVAGMEAKNCIFRIYRDIRFSPDKTPYKRQFSAYIVRGGRSSQRGGYYIHVEPGNCMISGGIWCPEPKLLKLLRKDIYEHIEEFVSILEEPGFKAIFPALEGETLKRMPAGYPADCPYGEIIRHKDFCVSTNLPDGFFFTDDWLENTAAIAQKLLPFNRFLNYTLDDFYGL